MPQLTRLVIATLALSLSVATLASPADAAPPPAGYPSATVISVTHNARLGVGIPLRRGFYDGDQDAGFGWDKLWNKHNIWDANAVKVLAASPSATQQSAGSKRYNLATWTGKITCNPLCKVTAQVELTLAVAPYYQKSYTYKSRLTGKNVVVPIATNQTTYGVVTGYCKGTVRCPKWVTYSLTNPGKVNPYRSSTGNPEEGQPASPSPASASASSVPLSQSDRADAESLKELTTTGDDYVYSYEPLTDVIDTSDVFKAVSSGSPISDVSISSSND